MTQEDQAKLDEKILDLEASLNRLEKNEDFKKIYKHLTEDRVLACFAALSTPAKDSAVESLFVLNGLLKELTSIKAAAHNVRIRLKAAQEEKTDVEGGF